MARLRDMNADELRARMARIQELNPATYGRLQSYRNTAAALRRLESTDIVAAAERDGLTMHVDRNALATALERAGHPAASEFADDPTSDERRPGLTCPDCKTGEIVPPGACDTCGLSWEDIEAAAAFTPAPPRRQRRTPARKEHDMGEKTIPTAETLAGGIGEATRPSKAPYVRIRVDGRTLAYVSARKDGVLLDFATGAVEGAPARFKKALEGHGARTTMRVTAKNEKGARALLEWLSKQD